MASDTVIWPEEIQETALDLTKRKSVIHCCHPKPNCDKECLPEKNSESQAEVTVKQEWNEVFSRSIDEKNLLSHWTDRILNGREYASVCAKNQNIFPNYNSYGHYAISIKAEVNDHLEEKDNSLCDINSSNSDYGFPNAYLTNRIPLPIKQRLRRLLLDGVKPKHAWRLLRLDGFPPESIPPLKRVQNFMKNSRKKLLTTDVNDWLEISAKTNPAQSNASINVQLANSLQHNTHHEMEYFSATPPRLNQTVKQRLCKMWLDGYKPKEAEFMLQNSDVSKESIPTIGQIRNFMKYCNRRGPPASSYPPFQMDTVDNYKNNNLGDSLPSEDKSNDESLRHETAKICHSELNESQSSASNEFQSKKINIKEENISEDESEEGADDACENISTESIKEDNVITERVQNIWPMFRQQMPLIIKRRLRQYLYDGVKPKQALRYLIHEGFPTDKLPSLKQIQNFMKNCKKRGLQFVPPPWMDYQHYTQGNDIQSTASLPEQENIVNTDIPSTSIMDSEENLLWQPTCNGRLTFSVKQKLFQLWMDGLKPKHAKRILTSHGLADDNMPTLKQIQNFMKYCRKRKVQLKGNELTILDGSKSDKIIDIKQDHSIYSDTTEDEDEDEVKIKDKSKDVPDLMKNDLENTNESSISECSNSSSNDGTLSEDSKELEQNSTNILNETNDKDIPLVSQHPNFVGDYKLDNCTENKNYPLNYMYMKSLMWNQLYQPRFPEQQFVVPSSNPNKIIFSDDEDAFSISDSDNSLAEIEKKKSVLGYSDHNLGSIEDTKAISLLLNCSESEQMQNNSTNNQPKRISYIVKVMLYKLLQDGLKPKQAKKVLLMEGLPPDKIPTLKQIQNFKKYCRRRGFCVDDDALMKSQLNNKIQLDKESSNLNMVDLTIKHDESEDDDKSIDDELTSNDKPLGNPNDSINEQTISTELETQSQKLICRPSLKSRFSPVIRKRLRSLFIEGIKPKEAQKTLVQEGFPLDKVPTLKQVQNFVKNSRKRRFPFQEEDWIPEALPSFLKTNNGGNSSHSESESVNSLQTTYPNNYVNHKIVESQDLLNKNYIQNNFVSQKESSINNLKINKTLMPYANMHGNNTKLELNNDINNDHLESILNDTNVTKRMTFGIKQKLYKFLIEGVKPKFARKLIISEGVPSERVPSLKQIQNFMKNCRKKGLPSDEMWGEDSRASSIDAGPSNAIPGESPASIEDSDNSNGENSCTSDKPDSDDNAADVINQGQINRVRHMNASILCNSDKKRMPLSVKRQLCKLWLSGIKPKSAREILISEGIPTDQIPNLKQIRNFMKYCRRRKLFYEDFQSESKESPAVDDEEEDEEEEEEESNEGNVFVTQQVSDSSDEPTEFKTVWNSTPIRKRMPLLVKQRLCELLLEGVKPRLAREILIDNGLPADKLPSLKQIQNFMKNCRKRGMPFVEEELLGHRPDLLNPVNEKEVEECLDLVTHNRNKDSKSLDNILLKMHPESNNSGTIPNN